MNIRYIPLLSFWSSGENCWKPSGTRNWFFLFFLSACFNCGWDTDWKIHAKDSSSSFSDSRNYWENLIENAPHLRATSENIIFQNSNGKKIISISDHFVKDSASQIIPKKHAADIVSSPPADFWTGRFRPIFVKSIRRLKGVRRFVSMRNGGLFYTDDGKKFHRVMEIPLRYVPEDYGGPVLYRDVEDMWQNPKREMHLLAINKHHIIESTDGGASFHTLPSFGLSADYTSISALADSNGTLKEIFLGTSVKGLYRIFLRNGKIDRSRVSRSSDGILYRNHNSTHRMYEKIAGIITDTERKYIIVKSAFHSGMYAARLPSSEKSPIIFRMIKGPDSADYKNSDSVYYDREKGTLLFGGENNIYLFRFLDYLTVRNIFNDPVHVSKSDLENFSYEENFWEKISLKSLNLEGGKKQNFLGIFLSGEGKLGISFRVDENRRDVPEQIRAFYISPYSARKRQKTILDLVQNYRFNAVVIDVKDDLGRIVYGSKFPFSREINNHIERAPLRDLIKKLKGKNLYLIARFVVFKDTVLYNYGNHQYAIRDIQTGGPWEGNSPEKWVDAYSMDVQNYNVRIASEVAALGFDEIQFDYIRFPADGPTENCDWSFRPAESYKSEALEAFLRKVRTTVNIPVSADIYGYNGFYRASAGIGQDMIDIGDYVDVISPMHYSSHYGPMFMENIRREDRAYELLYLGVSRPVVMSRGRYLVRPWLQSFKMATERWGWGPDYMKAQISGTLDGGGSGFLWWGPMDQFYMPGEVQKKIFLD